MKAMLEPKIVAASIQLRERAPHAVPAIPDRIVASSHGCFISVWMVIDPAWIQVKAE
jgi:hypothetical protein